MKTKRVCAEPGCPTLIPAGQGRCPEHARERDRARGTRQQRGYGATHDRTRADGIADARGTDCHLCGNPMLPGQPLHLDHTPDRTGYRGFAHASCNTSDGAKRGNALR